LPRPLHRTQCWLTNQRLILLRISCLEEPLKYKQRHTTVFINTTKCSDTMGRHHESLFYKHKEF
jgi:hypothetical protein